MKYKPFKELSRPKLQTSNTKNPHFFKGQSGFSWSGGPNTQKINSLPDWFWVPLIEGGRCLLDRKKIESKFQYPVPAEAKLGPAQFNPQLFGFIILKMEDGEYLAVWHSLAQLIICMTLSQNNKAGKIMYKRWICKCLLMFG